MRKLMSILIVMLLAMPLAAQEERTDWQQDQQIPAEHESLIRAFAYSEIVLNDSYYGVIALSNLADNYRPWYEADRDILILGFMKETVEAVIATPSTGIKYDQNDLIMLTSSVVLNRLGTGLYNWIRHGRFQLNDRRFHH